MAAIGEYLNFKFTREQALALVAQAVSYSSLKE